MPVIESDQQAERKGGNMSCSSSRILCLRVARLIKKNLIKLLKWDAIRDFHCCPSRMEELMRFLWLLVDHLQYLWSTIHLEVRLACGEMLKHCP